VLSGSTRMKAGTATKLVLNTLTTGAMVRLGKTYGNLMVDLQVRNQKLADRGERIVMEVAGVDRDRARAALEAAGGSVRTAIVMVRTGKDRAAAESLIADARGRLRAILGDPPPVDPS
jgi:N-acetylmuramic acid 6-phosphate etherase